ncbi:MAG: hypothetical protein F9K23_09680 [Bacteroidetes bacterium]|nr:MAG: hypothetical protein F9K23_09680 [Bacteroidota bacterium]
MRLLGWFKNKLFPKLMTKKLFEQGAYHESGHIIMAYLARFKSDQVTLLQNEPGSGFTRFDYSDPRITLIIAALKSYVDDPTIYNALDNSLKNSTPQIAFKILGTLLGGPVSEALYKTGVTFEGELPIEVSGPDLRSIESIHLYLSNNIANHPPNYIDGAMEQVITLLKQPNFWTAIEHLASTLLNSPNKTLNRQQIENSLLTSGFLNFIEQK